MSTFHRANRSNNAATNQPDPNRPDSDDDTKPKALTGLERQQRYRANKLGTALEQFFDKKILFVYSVDLVEDRHLTIGNDDYKQANADDNCIDISEDFDVMVEPVNRHSSEYHKRIACLNYDIIKVYGFEKWNRIHKTVPDFVGHRWNHRDIFIDQCAKPTFKAQIHSELAEDGVHVVKTSNQVLAVTVFRLLTDLKRKQMQEDEDAKADAMEEVKEEDAEEDEDEDEDKEEDKDEDEEAEEEEDVFPKIDCTTDLTLITGLQNNREVLGQFLGDTYDLIVLCDDTNFQAVESTKDSHDIFRTLNDQYLDFLANSLCAHRGVHTYPPISLEYLMYDKDQRDYPLKEAGLKLPSCSVMLPYKRDQTWLDLFEEITRPNDDAEWRSSHHRLLHISHADPDGGLLMHYGSDYARKAGLVCKPVYGTNGSLGVVFLIPVDDAEEGSQEATTFTLRAQDMFFEDLPTSIHDSLKVLFKKRGGFADGATIHYSVEPYCQELLRGEFRAMGHQNDASTFTPHYIIKTRIDDDKGFIAERGNNWLDIKSTKKSTKGKAYDGKNGRRVKDTCSAIIKAFNSDGNRYPWSQFNNCLYRFDLFNLACPNPKKEDFIVVNEVQAWPSCQSFLYCLPSKEIQDYLTKQGNAVVGHLMTISGHKIIKRRAKRRASNDASEE